MIEPVVQSSKAVRHPKACLPPPHNMIDNTLMLARRIIVLLLCTIAVASAFAADSASPLQDQYGKPGELSDFSGEAVLAIVVSTRKMVWIGRWEEAIRAELPGLVSIRVADVSDQPPPSYSDVAKILRKRAPEDVSVLIDMQNLWAKNYDLDTSETCLVLFDANHNVVAKFRGRPKGELVEEVMDALRDYFPATTQT
jgi:hypothetical protein